MQKQKVVRGKCPARKIKNNGTRTNANIRIFGTSKGKEKIDVTINFTKLPADTEQQIRGVQRATSKIENKQKRIHNLQTKQAVRQKPELYQTYLEKNTSQKSVKETLKCWENKAKQNTNEDFCIEWCYPLSMKNENFLTKPN